MNLNDMSTRCRLCFRPNAFKCRRNAYLQSNGITHVLILILKMPQRQPPPGMKLGHLVRATGSIYWTRAAGRAWHMHLRDALTTCVFCESELDRGFYTLCGPGSHKLVVVRHTHVDDCLVASDAKSECASAVLAKAKTPELLTTYRSIVGQLLYVAVWSRTGLMRGERSRPAHIQVYLR